ncbi:thiol reductant ABC exporter subunit CydC [Isoalcanivorax beigongshangi]|uniref:Thiol reductant ABC exporter subunit CydC n=1 Tax=Isoalcanivorax beigongshangi TaxID=3238810 RepID=A0ABV4AHT5_9GAMM
MSEARQDRRWLRELYREARWPLTGGALLALVTALAGTTLLALSGWFIAAAALAGLTSVSAAVSFNLLQPSSGIRALAITRTVSRYFERLISHNATFTVMQSLRTRLFAALLERIPGPLSRLSSGELLERLLGDVERLEQAWLGQQQPLRVALAMAVVLLAVGSLMVGPAMAALMLTLIALTTLLLWRLKRAAAPALAAEARHRDRVRSQLIQALRGLPELISLRQRAPLLRQWHGHFDALAQIETRLAARQAGTTVWIQFMVQGTAVLLMAVLARQVLAGELAAPMALAATLLVLGAAEILQPLAASAQRMPATGQAVRRLREIEQSPVTPSPCLGSGVPQHPDRLSVSGLQFAWPNSAPLYGPLDFSVRRGTPLALIGASGSGKSTLLHQLMGLQAGHGVIQLDDLAQHDADPHAWRNAFSLMLQGQHVFTGTLAENLRLARADASDEQLWSVLEQVELAELVRERGGLDLWIGPEGLHLSGGQGRRLALARLLLRDAPVVLLDEPLTGLDQRTAALLMERLLAAFADRILIVVTHDPRHQALFENNVVLAGDGSLA